MKEDILKYENREKLFKFLIDDFSFVKVEEKYSSENFGNFFIILSSTYFSLRYINDRSFLTIEISSNLAPETWFDLSFLRDLIYNEDGINADKRNLSNSERIEELNSFLRKKIDVIRELFAKENYPTTRKHILEGAKKQYERNVSEWKKKVNKD